MLGLVSDFVLSVVPADVQWQPDRETGRRAADLVESMTLVPGDGGRREVKWHDEVSLIDCGENLERIRCPHCDGEIDSGWWGILREERYTKGQGFADLGVTVPCCAAVTSLDRLEYEWPVAFARFEIAVWNPSKTYETGEGLLEADDVAIVEQVLGHPIRQVRAHY